MPIYTYLCPSCDIRFDKLVRNGSSRATCPECSTAKVERTMSLPAPHAGSTSESDLGPTKYRPPSGGGGCCGGGCHSHVH